MAHTLSDVRTYEVDGVRFDQLTEILPLDQIGLRQPTITFRMNIQLQPPGQGPVILPLVLPLDLATPQEAADLITDKARLQPLVMAEVRRQSLRMTGG